MRHVPHFRHALALLPALLLALVARASAQIVFEPPTSQALAHLTLSVISADINADGHADLISQPRFEMGFVQPSLSVLLGHGDGSFDAPIVTTLPTTNSGRGRAAFIDGDAFPDLAVGFDFSSATGITLLFGNGDGTFAVGPGFSLPGGFVGGSVADIVPIDLTNDGLLDFVIVEGGILPQFSGRISALVGVAGGRYTLRVGAALQQTGTSHAAVGDVNGDTIPDVIASNSLAGTLSVLAGLGDGTFAAPATLTVGGLPRDLVLADFDGDGPLDLALADAANSRVLVLHGDGAGHFATQQSVPVGTQPGWLSAGQLDNDGETDLLVSDVGSSELSVLRGVGDGGFTAVATVSNVPGAGGSTLADFDEDGVLDAAAAIGASPAIAVLRNHTYGAGSPFTDLGHAFPGGNGYPIQLADGTLQGGTPVSFRLLNALPGGQATLYVGFSEINAPFKGGTLVPFPNLLFTPLPINGAGATTLSATWPAGVASGFAFALQFWFHDASAANGFAGTNAVRIVTP